MRQCYENFKEIFNVAEASIEEQEGGNDVFWHLQLMIKIAVILFPGINCEDETLDAVKSAGMDGRIFRWNEKPELLKDFDGYIIPGGWSYEDRIRAGCISARDPIIAEIKKQAEKGKPVLGICNGAQVLVESGMVPDIKGGVEMALAPNINPFISGYYVSWVYLKSSSKKKTAFTTGADTVFRIPIAHGEGRFKTADKELLNELKKNDLIPFRYCDENGEIVYDFPVNPNGSMFNMAAVCNKKGNVMAMMPHPERANWERQVPGFKGSFEECEEKGPARFIFESMKSYIEARK